MSIGSGIGNMTSIEALAWRIFRMCKESTGDLRDLSGEVVSLHIVLKETQELVHENDDLNGNQSSQLEQLTNGCQKVLGDLERLLTKYSTLGLKSRGIWDRMRRQKEDIDNIRARLVSNTAMLSAYNATIVNQCQARVEGKLNQFMEEIRNGKRESLVESIVAEQPDELGDGGEWIQLRHELQDLGFSLDLLSQHRHFIINWFQQTISQEQATKQPASPIPSARNIPIGGEELLKACAEGNLEVVDYLLNHGVDVNYHRGDRMTPLCISAMFGFSDLTRLLLRQPAVNLNIKNHLGHTPLSLASWYGHDRVVRVLLDKPETLIDPTDSESCQTPLSLATEQGNTPVVMLLLSKGANPNFQDDDGMTSLAMAAKMGRPEETKLLLAAADIDPNLSDARGLTPLAHAIDSKNDIIVRLLLAHDGTDSNACDDRGISPLDRVSMYGFQDMYYLFEQAKARKMRSTS